MVSYFVFGFLFGLIIAFLIKELIEYPIRLSSLKRYMPWIKPAQVIRVDFKNKRKINN